MARVRDAKGARTRPREEDDDDDWRREVVLSAEAIADLSRDASALMDRLEKPPSVLSPTYETKIESVGFMTKNGKPKWKRVYIVLLGDHLLFYSARSKAAEILYQCEVCYFFISEVDNETLAQQQRMNPDLALKSSSRRIHVITYGEDWIKVCRHLMRAKFSLKELIAKEEACRVIAPLLRDEEARMWEENTKLRRSIETNGLFLADGKDRKMREGYLYLLEASYNHGTSGFDIMDSTATSMSLSTNISEKSSGDKDAENEVRTAEEIENSKGADKGIIERERIEKEFNDRQKKDREFKEKQNEKLEKLKNAKKKSDIEVTTITKDSNKDKDKDREKDKPVKDKEKTEKTPDAKREKTPEDRKNDRSPEDRNEDTRKRISNMDDGAGSEDSDSPKTKKQGSEDNMLEGKSGKALKEVKENKKRTPTSRDPTPKRDEKSPTKARAAASPTPKSRREGTREIESVANMRDRFGRDLSPMSFKGRDYSPAKEIRDRRGMVGSIYERRDPSVERDRVGLKERPSRSSAAEMSSESASVLSFTESSSVAHSGQSNYNGVGLSLKPLVKNHYRRYYVILTRESVFFFKGGNKEDLRQKPAMSLLLRFVTQCDFHRTKKQKFIVGTPLKKFVCEARHEIAAAEWVEKIRDLVARARGASLPPLRGAKEEKEDRGYVYSKPVFGRMYLVENAPKTYKVFKTKKHKLNKKGPSIIGRSNQVDITLNEEDVLVSRQHCKIIVEDNVPYLCDLGQCHHGTQLNGQTVVRAALKPGDVIGFGKAETTCVFHLKDEDKIFSVRS